MAQIKRFSVGQSAKFMGVLYSLLGLIFLPLFLIVALVGPEGSVPFGAIFAVAIPVMYGVMGAISGLVGAAMYNLVAGWVGGIDVEIE